MYGLPESVSALAVTPEETTAMSSTAPVASVSPLTEPPDKSTISPPERTFVALATPAPETISRPPLDTVVLTVLP